MMRMMKKAAAAAAKRASREISTRFPPPLPGIDLCTSEAFFEREAMREIARK
jgi:hypothetical protein